MDTDFCRGCHHDAAFDALMECALCGAAFHRQCAFEHAERHALTCKIQALLKIGDTAKEGAENCVRDADDASRLVQCLQTVPLAELATALVETRDPKAIGQFDVWKQVYARLLNNQDAILAQPQETAFLADCHLRFFDSPGSFPAVFTHPKIKSKRHLAAYWTPARPTLLDILTQARASEIIDEVYRVVEWGPQLHQQRDSTKPKKSTGSGALAMAPPYAVRLDDNDVTVSRLPHRINAVVDPHVTTNVADEIQNIPRDDVYFAPEKPDGAFLSVQSVITKSAALENRPSSKGIKTAAVMEYTELANGRVKLFWSGPAVKNGIPRPGKAASYRTVAKNSGKPHMSFLYMIVDDRDLYVVAARYSQAIQSEALIAQESEEQWQRRRAAETRQLIASGAMQFSQWITDASLTAGTLAATEREDVVAGVSSYRMAITHYVMHLDNIRRLADNGLTDPAQHYYAHIRGSRNTERDPSGDYSHQALVVDPNSKLWFPPEAYISAPASGAVSFGREEAKWFQLPHKLAELMFMRNMRQIVIEWPHPIDHIWLAPGPFTRDSNQIAAELESLVLTGYAGNLGINTPWLHDPRVGAITPRLNTLRLTRVTIKSFSRIAKLLKAGQTRQTLYLEHCKYHPGKGEEQEVTLALILRKHVLSANLRNAVVLGVPVPSFDEVGSALNTGIVALTTYAPERVTADVEAPEDFVTQYAGRYTFVQAPLSERRPDAPPKRTRVVAPAPAAPMIILDDDDDDEGEEIIVVETRAEFAVPADSEQYRLQLIFDDKQVYDTVFTMINAEGTSPMRDVHELGFVRSLFPAGLDADAIYAKALPELSRKVREQEASLSTVQPGDVFYEAPANTSLPQKLTNTAPASAVRVSLTRSGVDDPIVLRTGVISAPFDIAVTADPINLGFLSITPGLTAPLPVEQNEDDDMTAEVRLLLLLSSSGGAAPLLAGVHVHLFRMPESPAFLEAREQFAQVDADALRTRVSAIYELDDPSNLPEWFEVWNANSSNTDRLAMHSLWVKEVADTVSITGALNIDADTLDAIHQESRVTLTQNVIRELAYYGDRAAAVLHVTELRCADDNPPALWQQLIERFNLPLLPSSVFQQGNVDEQPLRTLRGDMLPLGAIQVRVGAGVALNMTGTPASTQGNTAFSPIDGRDGMVQLLDFISNERCAPGYGEDVPIPICYAKQTSIRNRVTSIDIVLSQLNAMQALAFRIACAIADAPEANAFVNTKRAAQLRASDATDAQSIDTLLQIYTNAKALADMPTNTPEAENSARIASLQFRQSSDNRNGLALLYFVGIAVRSALRIAEVGQHTREILRGLMEDLRPVLEWVVGHVPDVADATPSVDLVAPSPGSRKRALVEGDEEEEEEAAQLNAPETMDFSGFTAVHQQGSGDSDEIVLFDVESGLNDEDD